MTLWGVWVLLWVRGKHQVQYYMTKYVCVCVWPIQIERQSDGQFLAEIRFQQHPPKTSGELNAFLFLTLSLTVSFIPFLPPLLFPTSITSVCWLYPSVSQPLPQFLSPFFASSLTVSLFVCCLFSSNSSCSFCTPPHLSGRCSVPCLKQSIMTAWFCWLSRLFISSFFLDF